MIRLFYKILQLVSVVIAVAILAKFLSGQVYVRQPPIGVINGSSSDNITDSWPWKITLDLSSFVGAIPNPNFDVAEADLVAAWHLPPKSRLSLIMRQMARCELAARARPFHDTTQCHRVQFWPIIVFASVSFVAVFNSYRFIFGFPVDKVAVKNAQTIFRSFMLSCVPFVAGWFVTAIFDMVYDFITSAVDLGLSYTPYGEMDPEPYYPVTGDWFFIGVMIQIGYYVSAVECYAHGFERFSISKYGKKIKAWLRPAPIQRNLIDLAPIKYGYP